MDKYNRLVKNTLLVFGGNIGAKLITLVMMPLYTRWLSVEGYGLTDLLTIYVTLLLSVVSCCIPEALFVFPSGAEKDKQKQYFSTGVSFNYLTMAIAGIIFFAMDQLSYMYQWSNSFFQNVWLIYFMLISSIFQQQCQQFARSTGHMIVYSVTGFLYTACVACLSFALVPTYGVQGYVYCIIISNVASALFSFIGSKAGQFISLKSIKLSVLKEMLKYSIPLIPNSIMWWLVNALNRPLLESNLGLHEIGIYAVSNRFPGLLSMVFAVFATSWQISVLEEYKKSGFEVFYNKIFKLVFFGLVLVQLGLTFTSKILVRLFASSDFFEAWTYVSILSLGTLISCLSSFVGVVFSATRQSKYYLYSSIYGAAASLILNYLLIPIWGTYGACLSIIVSFSIITLSRIYYSWETAKVRNIGYYLTSLFFLVGIIFLYIHGKQIIAFSTSVILLIYISKNNISELKNLYLKLTKYHK